ncbi:MAG: hypothetical protein R3C68_01660 [Myxococcota bacterium]
MDGLRNGANLGGRQGFRLADGTVNGVSTTHRTISVSTTLKFAIRFSSNILTTDATHNEFLNLTLHHAAKAYGIYMSSGNNLMQGCTVYASGLQSDQSVHAGYVGFGIHNYSGASYQPATIDLLEIVCMAIRQQGSLLALAKTSRWQIIFRTETVRTLDTTADIADMASSLA